MKAIRTYHVRSCWVFLTIDFVLDDDDEFNEDTLWVERYSIYMRAQVGYRKPDSRTGAVDRFHVRAHPNVPRNVVFDETVRFLSTLKQMYQL